jgi:transposase InsO family protein
VLVQAAERLQTKADLSRMTDAHRRALGETAHGLSPDDLAACEPIVTVNTLRRYYRELVVAKWASPHTGAPGRPPLAAEAVQAVLRIAQENPRVGAPGIVRRLAVIGITVSESSVRNILRGHDVGPAPERSDESDWRIFLESHAEQIAAIDATAVETLVDDRLVTQWCVMAIHHDTRRVHLLGVTDSMNQDWMVQQARNLTDPDHGFLRGRRFLIMDRDPAFSERFRSTLKAVGVESVRIPPSSPNCNPFIERFFRSLKEECLSHCIPMGQAGLRHLVSQYLEHYHRERPHAGLDGAVIEPDPLLANRNGAIARKDRLGGLLTMYHRVAA